MKRDLPIDVVRKIIYDILIERGNNILNDADEMAEEEIKEFGGTDQYVAQLRVTSAGIYVLADDVLSGEISIREALEDVLNPFEKKLAKSRCEEWLNKHNETER